MQFVKKTQVRVDGNIIPTENTAVYSPAGYNRPPETHNDIHYFGEEGTAPMLEVTVIETKDIDVDQLSKWTGITAFFENDVGRKRVMRNAWVTEPVVSDGAGRATMKLSCQQVDLV